MEPYLRRSQANDVTLTWVVKEHIVGGSIPLSATNKIAFINFGDFMKIKLTWKIDKKVFTENCYLVPDDAQLCDENGDLAPSDYFDKLKQEGFVMLENEKGVFLVNAKHILKVEQIN